MNFSIGLRLVYDIFCEILTFKSSFNFFVVGNSKKEFYKKERSSYIYSVNYRNKPYSKKKFYPCYAKTSKMINQNRYGRHSNLERSLTKNL